MKKSLIFMLSCCSAFVLLSTWCSVCRRRLEKELFDACTIDNHFAILIALLQKLRSESQGVAILIAMRRLQIPWTLRMYMGI